MRTACAVAIAILISGCTTPLRSSPDGAAAAVPQTAADAFFDSLLSLCGKAYGGKLVAFNAADVTAFGGAAVMHVRDCSADEVRIPFHVGDNRSRTWIITRTANGLRLKHDHRHEDGSSDALTMYGGDSIGATSGTATRQEFPADAESKALFEAGNMKISMDNVWAIDVIPGQLFAYELRRPGRHFRVDFNLADPLPLPPPAWGYSVTR